MTVALRLFEEAESAAASEAVAASADDEDLQVQVGPRTRDTVCGPGPSRWPRVTVHLPLAVKRVEVSTARPPAKQASGSDTDSDVAARDVEDARPPKPAGRRRALAAAPSVRPGSDGPSESDSGSGPGQ